MTFTRESIFVSAIRCFCNAFSVVIGIFIAAVVVMFGLALFSSPEILPEKSELSIAPDADGRRTLLPETSPAILRIDFHGIIGDGDLTNEKIQNILFDSREDSLRNNRVKAVLLHMNTPGGVASDAAGIYDALLAYKKKYNVPVYAFVDGMCASGGMYICAAADKMYATSSSVIGSVGVILGPTFNFSGAMEKFGIQSLTITQGKDKDMLNPFRPWKEGEDQSLVNITKELYEQFVTAVATGRPRLDREKLVNVYGAQVFIAPEAQTLGYIDVSGADYGQTLNELATAADIAADQRYQVVQLETPHTFLSQLAQGKSSLFSGKISHVFQIGPNMSSELSGKFLYLYQPSDSY
jgi:protease IV